MASPAREPYPPQTVYSSYSYCIMSTLATIPIITDPAALSACLPRAHDLAASLVISADDDELSNDWSLHITQLHLLATLWSIEDNKTRHEKLVELHEQIRATSEQEGEGSPAPALALRSSIDRSLPFISSSMRSVFGKPSTVEQSAFQLRMLGGLVLCRTAELVNHFISRANDTERPPWIELLGQYRNQALRAGVDVETRRQLKRCLADLLNSCSCQYESVESVESVEASSTSSPDEPEDDEAAELPQSNGA